MPEATAPDLLPVVHRFVERVRAAGVVAPPDRVQAFVAALDALGAGDPMDVARAGRVTLCGDQLELRRYDAVVAEVFAGRRPPRQQRPLVQLRASAPDDDTPPATPDDGDEDAPSLVADASRTERLRHRDVADLTDDEREDLRRLLATLRLPGETRATRRHRRARRGGLDRHATVRAMLAAGGEPARLHHRARRTRPRDVVLLLDVSGSMAAHADALLRFAHATARGHGGRTEVFTLGTRLTRITRELSLRDPDVAMRAVAAAVEDWAGGTRLGDGLRRFLDDWGQRGTARGAVAVVLSDGWERGDVTELGVQTARLSRLAHRLVWANPRAGREGFAPTAAGMAAVLPFVDQLVPVTTLAGLQELARVVAGTDTATDTWTRVAAAARAA